MLAIPPVYLCLTTSPPTERGPFFGPAWRCRRRALDQFQRILEVLPTASREANYGRGPESALISPTLTLANLNLRVVIWLTNGTIMKA
jgi:hypothetical protein